MYQQPYDMRKEPDGTWTVFEMGSGLPAVVNDVPQNGLEMEQAEDMVDLLNRLVGQLVADGKLR